MKRITVFIVLLVLCLLLAIWAPWKSWNFTLGSFFGIKQATEVSGLQVYSLSGTLDIYLDDTKIGEVVEGVEPYIKDDIAPGEHILNLQRQSDVENAYWKFSKVIDFYKGTTVVASYNLGPAEDFSEGHVIYSAENSNPANKNNLIVTTNVSGASLSVDSNPEIVFEGTTLTTELLLDSQHQIRIHKVGYDDLVFTMLPASQEDRDKLQGLILNLDAHLLLQPVQLEVK